MLKIFMFAVVILFLGRTLFPTLHLGPLISVLCFMIVVLTFFRSATLTKVLGSVFLLSGALLLLNANASFSQYIYSFGPMLDLLTLFTLVPILGIPIKIGEYSKSIQTLIYRNVQSSGILYMMTSGVSYFFSIFMNLATLPMAYHSIGPSLNNFSIRDENRFMSRAVTRGFAMPLIWAPVTPIVGIVIGMTHVSWLSVLPYVIPISIGGLLMDWYIGSRRSNKRVETDIRGEWPTDPTYQTKRIVHIFTAIVIFNIVISIMEQFFDYSFLILVSLLVIPFAFAWSLFLRKSSEFSTQIKEHILTFPLKMKDQFFIFLSAGFFISSIEYAQADHQLNEWILSVMDAIGVHLFIVLLPLIPLVLAFAGLHPAVSLALMAGALNADLLGISPYILTTAMLAGAVSAFLVGPYNATLGLMSNMMSISSYKVSNWNLPFAAYYIVFVMLYLVALQLII